MAVNRTDYLSALWTDNQIQIFEQVWGGSQNLNHRQISKKLCILVDLLVRKRWEDLLKNPVPGPFGFKEACTRIHEKFSVGGKYPEGFNYLELFRGLNKEWGLVGVKISNSQLNVTRSHQNELQNFLYNKLNDHSLMRMWEMTFIKLYFLVPDDSSDPVSLRQHLATPHVQTGISTILKINFSELGMRFIPIEIMYFCSLEELKLSYNHIDSLPDYIGNLKKLRILDLEDNDLQELPEDFPNWVHLEEVNLKDNPLNDHGKEQYAAWKRNRAKSQ